MTGMKSLCIRALMALAVVLTFASCDDSFVFDDEGDCTVHYRLKFVYDYNMKYADAFPHEVTSVAVYAFDKSGKLVWQQAEKGDKLAADDYYMELELPAGDYDLVAWCGTDNDATSESFTVPQLTIGSSEKSELTCKLNRQHDSNGEAYVDSNLYGLYHGQVSVNLPDNEDGDTFYYTMPLVKDTNHLRVILQHLSGEDVDVSKFTFSLDDENGYLDYDNSLLADENINYRAWNTESGYAGVVDTRAQTQVNVAIADLTTSRLMVDHKMYLTIRNNEGEVVVKVPFIDYALLIKGNYNKSMTDQEFLDRQDEWSMTFFLDDDERWISTYIYIQSWRVVLSNTDLTSSN